MVDGDRRAAAIGGEAGRVRATGDEDDAVRGAGMLVVEKRDIGLIAAQNRCNIITDA